MKKFFVFLIILNKGKRPAVYKSWCNEILKFRKKKKGRKYGFKINKSFNVCEIHFKRLMKVKKALEEE